MSSLATLDAFLAVFTACAGLQGAWYWLKSSKVPIDPWKGRMAPVDPEQHQIGWLAEMLRASKAAADFNAIAARWDSRSDGFRSGNNTSANTFPSLTGGWGPSSDG